MHLYIHIPFCVSKCSYCDFNSSPLSNFKPGIINEYINSLVKELYHIRKKINKKHVNLKTIYIGGGTPSILAEAQLKTLIFAIREYFGLTGSLEFTIECNPDSIKKEKLRFYKGIGINRISLGVQTFYESLLKLLERPGGEKVIIEAIENIKKEGFNNFSFDLMFALPHQTTDMFIKDLKKAVSFDPPHISLYCLTLTPASEHIFKSKNLSIPGEDEQVKMYEEGVKLLQDKDYNRYEISNFAKEGFESRHNLSYWSHKEYIGIGAGASSYLNGYRIKNTSDINQYIKDITAKGLAIEEKKKIFLEETKSEFVFLSLRLSGGLEFEKYRQKFRSDFLVDFKDFIQNWKDKNMFNILEDRIKLTENGILLSDELFRDLF